MPEWRAPAGRIVTARLVLRRWRPDDAPALKAAIDASLAELKPWIPWAAQEPSPVEKVRERVSRQHEMFDTGPEYAYAIFDRDERELIGGIGLFARVGPEALEIGYWIRSDQAGHGIATEATEAVTAAGRAMGARHIEIHCDPDNVPSARVAAKLGYRHAVTIEKNFSIAGGPLKDTMIWVWPAAAEPWMPPANAPA